jgi:ATP-dependent helicase/DNAse subunit B
MNIETLPYGNAGWSARAGIAEEIIAARPGPPFIFDTVLIIVPVSRMRRAYGRLFLDVMERIHGASALVQPDVLTLHQFFSRLYAKLDAPPVIDENSRLIALEGIVKELIAGRPEFGRTTDILAPSLSSAVAAMIEQLSSSAITAERLAETVGRSDFPDKPQVRLLTEAFVRYERILADRGLVDPGGMLDLLDRRFDPSWLAQYVRIVIDGVHETGELQARLLKKIADHAHCTLLVEALSRENIERAGDRHPLRLVRIFLEKAGVLPGPSRLPPPPEDQLLGETLFSNISFADTEQAARTLPSFSRDIRLLSAVNMREEVSLVAACVKESLQNGTQPDSVLTAFPSLDEYGPLAEEIFGDYGIPYNRALGRQLSSSPVTTAMLSLLRACQEDFSGPSLLRVLSSPFLKFADRPSLPPSLDRLMRRRRISGGKEKLRAALRRRPGDGEREQLAEALTDLFHALAPFAVGEPAPLHQWMEKLQGLLNWSGIDSRVDLIKGALNINLQAYRKLEETLVSLDHAARLFPAYRYTFDEWLFLLRKTFMHTRFQVPPEDEGGVQILGLHESAVHGWNEIYLGGLVDGKFPQRPPQNIFLPEAVLETLGLRIRETARMNAGLQFYRLLLSAPKVTLTFPENEGDRPVTPSPFLEELTPLRNAGLINRGVTKTTGLQFSLKIEDSRSIPELAKAVSVAGDATVLQDIVRAGIKGAAAIAASVVPESRKQAPVLVPQNKREFTVTELDAYLRCPYDYYVARVLGIEPLEEVTEDISAAKRGSTIHAILREFYQLWSGPVSTENRDHARRLLEKLATDAFGRESDTFRNRRERDRFLNVMAGRFLDAEEEFWKQGMKPLYLELDLGQFSLRLTNGEEALISGKVDRIDADEDGNFMIVDYKTGSYPLARMEGEQEIFQLPVYAVMAQVAKHAAPALKRPMGLVYYDLAGKTGAGARDVVLFDKEARNDHPSSKPRASARSAGEFERILQNSMARARSAVEGILAGEFSTRPQNENRCRFCPSSVMCESEEPDVS